MSWSTAPRGVAAADVLRAFGAWLRALVRSPAQRLRRNGTLVLSSGRNEGPPDLDELWRDFNRKLSGMFGKRGQSPGGPPDRPDGGGPFQPNMKGAGIGAGLIAGVVALVWLGSGVFIVQEGQQAVVTSFGRYAYTTDAGIKWRFPYPFQAHEIVPVTQLRSVEMGRNTPVPATGLRDSSMLTQDENIVDIRFTVQYRLKDARAFLFENRNPDEAVVMASESAVREVVGRSNIDAVLYRARDVLAAEVLSSVQAQLDRLNAGIQVANVNVQQVAVPDQVQASFNDAVKATADRDRFKNEGEAYASDVIPRAQGTAARLREEAEGYRARVVSMAEGDAERFRSVVDEYKKAPVVTRDRMYIDTMQQVMSNVSKVLVDTRGGSNLLYLPLDKLMQQAGGAAAAVPPAAAETVPTPAAPAAPSDARSRDNARSRERETR
ncbi:MAG: FtsH protease activity modulator HflK [Rubrivivax sp.]|mgnify:FL=1|nr:FtsH protease activity modulator HflK [Rubrivivax sp.]HRY88911.1 FtsH protease activity modulator HflK [Rubrivivax sp.]